MSTTTLPEAPGTTGRAARPPLTSAIGPWLLPSLAALIIFGLMIALRPLVASPTGLTLVLAPLIPLVFAVLAQMFVIAAGDIDLGIGSFIGLANVVIAVVLPANAAGGILFLVGMVLAYAAMGVLIAVRGLPSIVVTLGMSFVWLGVAILILPTPGGTVSEGIVGFVRFNTPVVPGVIIVLTLVTAIVAVFLHRSKYGAVLRGSGSNPEGVRRAGWSVIRAKVGLYVLAAIFGLLSGLYLSGQTGGGDPYIAQSYVLLSIAGVIVGGGTFRGGEVSVVGAVAGGLVVGLLGSLLQFIGVQSSFQAAAQGLVLVLVLVLRAVAHWIRKARRTL
ncbi:monosaccharide ABC transporter membrane protein (CUT2 family) [Labedella gwakjiensis]|uniref:Autoinducer 2 import system permease protein LsrD n=1 Tax=Labedella gwakjiensis TaxID=390269 RepID=A0A2P8GU96_9MICO|nr:ABC transporter permease [Labedella gwakjiensis]PSL37542.1 monosaccharide ABC transporter membrane protein (CUT2 family) [Labedella gwakjiensis]RUQ84842.1 ABC transporter permease [Labedella gwakjiensis]